MRPARPPVCQATLRKGRLRGAVKVGTLLFPGYSSERAVVIFMRCEVGTFAAAGRISSIRTHASARLHPHTSRSREERFCCLSAACKSYREVSRSMQKVEHKFSY